MLITKSAVKFFIDEAFTDSLGHKILRLRTKGNATMTLNYFISAIKQISLIT